MTVPKSESWLDALTKIGALAGGLFALWQYLEGKQDARVERTFTLVGAMEQGELAKAREVISAELRGRLAELARIHATQMPPAVAAAVHAKVVRTLVLKSRGGSGLGAELHLLLDRFDKVQICTEKGLCDKDTARAFLGDYAHILWTNFRPHIEEQSKIIPGYGAGLRRFIATLPAEQPS